jgi:hypothetical protein
MKRLNLAFGAVFAHPLFICIALLLPQCANRHRIIKKEINVFRPAKETPVLLKKNTPPPITVWIHGTRLLKNTPYITEFNCCTQLKFADELKSTCPLYTIARSVHLSNPERFAWDTFYVFGWSGALNGARRQEAGKKLYIQLAQIVDIYRAEYGTEPVIRLLTHSHGGNLALCMARLEDTHPFAIDELIMLACPVQYETCDAIKSSLFTQIYNIYSPLDLIQIVAPQFNKQKANPNGSRTWIPTSARRFEEHPKIVQTKVKINGRALFHEDFIKPNFLQSISEVVDTMVKLKDEPGYSTKEHLVSITVGNKRRD